MPMAHYTSVRLFTTKFKSCSCKLNIQVPPTIIWPRELELWNRWHLAVSTSWLAWVSSLVFWNQAWTSHRSSTNPLSLNSTSRPSRCSNIFRAISSTIWIQQLAYSSQTPSKVWHNHSWGNWGTIITQSRMLLQDKGSFRRQACKTIRCQCLHQLLIIYYNSNRLKTSNRIRVISSEVSWKA